MHFICDVERLDGVLVDDPVLTFSCKDTVPIMMLLVDTPALGTVDVVVAGELAEVCADNLRRGATPSPAGVSCITPR